MIYTEKQKELLKLWKQNKLKRINLLEGSVSSGKTWISLVLWAFYIATSPQNGKYLMAAKSLTTLKRNCLDVLEDLVGKKNFKYNTSKKEAFLFGRLIYLEGVNDLRSESKIRGLSLNAAYCDELTLFTEDFFVMLLSRLRKPGAKLIATTNPDSPKHWLMTNFIKNPDINMLAVKFLIDDNTFLPKDYIEDLKKEYTGVFKKRFIDGEWVIAEGLVYDFFDETNHCYEKLPDSRYEYYISIDYGTQNPFAMLLWAVDTIKQKAYLHKEYYYDGRKEKIQKTDSEYYEDLFEFAKGYLIDCVIIDPSASSFKTEIRKRGYFSVRNAENDVVEGIRYTASYMKCGKIFINKKCKNTINEFTSYSWDSKSGEDKVIKENDHAMDAMRYMAHTVLRYLAF